MSWAVVTFRKRSSPSNLSRKVTPRSAAWHSTYVPRKGVIQGTGSAESQGRGKASAEGEGRVSEGFSLTPEKVRVWSPDSETRRGAGAAGGVGVGFGERDREPNTPLCQAGPQHSMTVIIHKPLGTAEHSLLVDEQNEAKS